jgi:outer membrane protein insertion porin family
MICIPLLLLAFFSNELVTAVGVRGVESNVKLETQVGRRVDEKSLAQDVRRLWSMGRFEDIRVETTDQPDGTAVVFEVTPARSLRLRVLRVEPGSYGLRLKVPENTPLDRLRAHEIAAEAGRQLRAQGYRDAHVDYDMVPVAKGLADLRLTVHASDPVRVKSVEFSGNPALDPAELRGSLKAMRARRILFWRILPAYSPEAVESDLARIVSLYLSKGYFDAAVRVEDTAIEGEHADLRVSVDTGQQYRAVPVDCAELLAERRQAEREGILDFSVRVEVQPVEDSGANLNTTIERGPAYRVGRIVFSGNRRFSDTAVRSNFVLDEAAPFDEYLLRKSLARLNRSNWFEPVTTSSVAIYPDESRGEANLVVRLTEPKRGKWSLSGPVGPSSVGGPLKASIGERIASYSVSLSLIAFAHPIVPALAVVTKRFVPVAVLERPYTPAYGWLSGFAIAPQLGWQALASSYATTQLRQRLTPLLAGGRDLTPDLPVVMETPTGEKTLFCEASQPRFFMLRTAAAMGLQVLASVPIF